MNTPTLPLAVIDVQPGFSEAFTDCYVSDLINEIRARLRASLPVYLVYVDEELSGDTLESVKQFWAEHGLEDEELEECTFIEKQYAELRGWMDIGIDEDEIVAAIRTLRSKNLWDTRMLEPQELEAVSEEGSTTVNPLFRSYHLEQSPLRNLRELDICGGGRNECLKEVELWMQSIDANYNRLEEFSYGG